jgi:hypothetical protein
MKHFSSFCRNHQEPPGTTTEQVWYARKLYESAFHPDSGELQNFCGRMSFQVPGGMLITGFMLQFYRFVKDKQKMSLTFFFCKDEDAEFVIYFGIHNNPGRFLPWCFGSGSTNPSTL